VSAITQTEVEGYLVIALFALFVLRRAWGMTQGARASIARLTVLPALYVAIYAAELAAIVFAGMTASWATSLYVALGADAVCVGVGVFAAYGYTARHVELYHPAGASAWYFRLTPLLPVLYVVLFLVRIVVETIIVGGSPFNLPSTAQLDSTAPFELYALLAVDALWGLTTGMLVGRSAATYAAWQKAKRSGSTGATPLP